MVGNIHASSVSNALPQQQTQSLQQTEQLNTVQEAVKFNKNFDRSYQFNSRNVFSSLSKTRERINPLSKNQRTEHQDHDQVMVAGWRKHYLESVKASKATNPQQALAHNAKALEHLQAIPSNTDCLITQALVGHSKALIHYEMGVLERDLTATEIPENGDEYSTTLFDKALSHFKSAQSIYEALLNQSETTSNTATYGNKRTATSQENRKEGADLNNTEKAFEPVLQYFNQNTPFHCMANCLFNAACIEDESINSDDAKTISDLRAALILCAKGEAYLNSHPIRQEDKPKQNAANLQKAITTFLRSLDPSSTTQRKPAVKRQRVASTITQTGLGSTSQTKRTPKEPINQVNESITAVENIREPLNNLGATYQGTEDQFLRAHQKIQLVQILEAFNSGEASPKVACQMPTGTGKTAVMAALIALINNECSKDGTRGQLIRPNIIVAVPSLPLVTQTKAKLFEYGHAFSGKFKPLETLTEKVGVWSGVEKEIKPITITTYNSLIRFFKKLSDQPIPENASWDQRDCFFHPGNKNTVLIFDEAHRCNGQSISKFLKSAASDKLVVGFSGSADEYKDTIPLRILAPLSITDAIDQNAIAPVEFLDLQFTHHPKVIAMKKRIGIKANQELSQEQREAIDTFLVTSSGITLTAARTVQKLFIEKDPKTKIMVFCNTKIHTQNAADIFNAIGVKAVYTHGDLPQEEQSNAIKAFEKKNDASVMISCGQLDEGYDFPRENLPKGVSVVVDFVPHINKGRLIQQRLGRATRSTTDSSQKVATYIRIKLIAGDVQKPSWDILNGDPRKRSHGVETANLTNSDPFDLTPLAWRSPLLVPAKLREITDKDTNSITAYSARLRFAHTANNTIKLGEGVPDDDEVEEQIELGAGDEPIQIAAAQPTHGNLPSATEIDSHIARAASVDTFDYFSGLNQPLPPSPIPFDDEQSDIELQGMDFTDLFNDDVETGVTTQSKAQSDNDVESKPAAINSKNQAENNNDMLNELDDLDFDSFLNSM